MILETDSSEASLFFKTAWIRVSALKSLLDFLLQCFIMIGAAVVQTDHRMYPVFYVTHRVTDILVGEGVVAGFPVSGRKVAGSQRPVSEQILIYIFAAAESVAARGVQYVHGAFPYRSNNG